MKKSNICEDDIGSIRRILEILTKKKSTWEALLSADQDWIDYSTSLLTIQQQILESRRIALDGMSMRMTYCAEFDFSKIEPIVVGSNIGLPGDTVRFEVFQAAYNQFEHHEASIDRGGKLVKIENGKAYFEAVLPDSGKVELNGVLIREIRSGKKIERNWSHAISVLEHGK